MERVKFGIVSYAHPHVMRYAPAIAKNEKTELVAIASEDVNRDLAIADAKKYGAKFYCDYSELLQDGDVDAVYIASESFKHFELAVEAMENGKHVLLEKPIAMNTRDASELIRIASREGVKLMVPFNPRFTQPLKKAYEMIRDGEIGKLVYVTAISENVKPPIYIRGFNAEWFLDPAKSGGGGFMDTAPHGIDSLLWLVGEPRRIYADIGAKVYGLPVDDIGTAMIEFNDGIVALLTAGWGNPKGYPWGLEVKYHLVGENGFLDVRTAYPDFEVYGEGAERVYWERPDVDSIVQGFAEAVLEDHPVPISPNLALKNLEIVLTAYESSRKKEWVNL